MSDRDMSDLAAEVLQQLKRLQAADDERYQQCHQLAIRAGRHDYYGKFTVDLTLDVEHKDGRKLYVLQIPDVDNKIQFEARDLDTALALFHERCRERGDVSVEKHYKTISLQIYDKSSNNVITMSNLKLKDSPFAESEYKSVRIALRIVESAYIEPPGGWLPVVNWRPQGSW